MPGDFFTVAEYRATYSRVTISVGDQVVTRLDDEGARTVRDSLFVPLYPMAEWIALNWFALWNESEPLRHERRASYRRSHGLGCAGGGFSWPALRLNPIGNLVQLCWEPLSRNGVRFLAGGGATVSKEGVRREFTRLVEAVVRRLEAFGIEGTELQTEWRSVTALGDDERTFGEFAAALGLDPFDPTR